MNGVHIHLLLNHIPVIGMLIGLAVFALGVWRRNDSWTRLALGLFVVVAVASLATMLTGEGAEEAAELAAWASYLLGAVSLAGLIWVRGRALPRSLTVAILPLVVLVTGLMAYTANLGGQIRHTEIRAAELRTED